MVQNDLPKRRGRPRAYDPDQALDQARDAFWAAGYAATSLDELSAATGMNRPSLYGAFGDKQALYLTTLRRYREASTTAIREVLSNAPTAAEALRGLYHRALNLYFSTPEAPRGCFLIGTGLTEAVGNAEVRAELQDALARFEAQVADRLRQAVAAGELPGDSDPEALAAMALAVLHSLAVRARAGTPREALERLAENAVALLTPGRR